MFPEKSSYLDKLKAWTGIFLILPALFDQVSQAVGLAIPAVGQLGASVQAISVAIGTVVLAVSKPINKK